MSQDEQWAGIPVLRVRPRHCWRSLPFLLSAWQLPLLSPLPWQCQPGSHGVSACASARQTRSHAGLEPRTAPAQAGGLTQPQNAAGVEMERDMSLTQELVSGWEAGGERESAPGTSPCPALLRQPGALHHSRAPVPHSHPGLSHSPLCWYELMVPKAISSSTRLH